MNVYIRNGALTRAGGRLLRAMRDRYGTRRGTRMFLEHIDARQGPTSYRGGQLLGWRDRYSNRASWRNAAENLNAPKWRGGYLLSGPPAPEDPWWFRKVPRPGVFQPSPRPPVRTAVASRRERDAHWDPRHAQYGPRAWMPYYPWARSGWGFGKVPTPTLPPWTRKRKQERVNTYYPGTAQATFRGGACPNPRPKQGCCGGRCSI
jgi:hypothetical protein